MNTFKPAFILMLCAAAASVAHASPLIVPGKQLGDIFLGQSDQSVFARLKKPDGGDAAMGKAWSFWNAKDSRQPDGKPNVLGIFTAHNPDDRVAYVQQIRATSPYFHTASGISTKSTLAQVKKAFPHAKRLATSKAVGASKPVEVYDDVKAGIAWQFVQGGRCLAIIVHPKGRAVTANYLPMPS